MSGAIESFTGGSGNESQNSITWQNIPGVLGEKAHWCYKETSLSISESWNLNPFNYVHNGTHKEDQLRYIEELTGRMFKHTKKKI